MGGITVFTYEKQICALQMYNQNHSVTETIRILGYLGRQTLVHIAVTFFLGTGSIFLHNSNIAYATDLAIMAVVATFVYSIIFQKTRYNILYVLLIGTVLTSFFSSIQSTLVRAMDPNEYETLLTTLVASFSSINSEVIMLAAVILAVVIFALRKELVVLDVITLGKDQAINLGVDYDPSISCLAWCCLSRWQRRWWAPSPFGLIVANIARQLFKTYRHQTLILASALIGAVLLLAGQLIVEHVFDPHQRIYHCWRWNLFPVSAANTREDKKMKLQELTKRYDGKPW